MELKLQNFVDQLTTITNNALLDKFNPSVVKLTNGITEELFAICVSVLEPTYIYLPYNAIWICVAPASNYYKQPLRLVGKERTLHPSLSEERPINEPLFIDLWVYADRYTDLFHTNMQESRGNPGDQGIKGQQGDQGIKGQQGDLLNVDYPYLIEQAFTRLRASL